MTGWSGSNGGWKLCVNANPPSSSRSGDPVRELTRSANQSPLPQRGRGLEPAPAKAGGEGGGVISKRWISAPFALSAAKGLMNRALRLPPPRSMAARRQSLFAIAQKVTKNASPCTPLHPPVLTTGGMRQRHTKASLTLRTVCADDASTTARCCAPRRGLKTRFEPILIASR